MAGVCPCTSPSTMKAQACFLPLLAILLLPALLPADVLSHAPMRPLPLPSARLLGAGPHKFVDATKGSDAQEGSEQRPWKTLAFAAGKIAPGETIVLRAGIYREHVVVKCAGTQEKPIVIRSHPGALVVLDGGLPDFYDNPSAAWEPYAAGAPGEYRSTKTYENAGVAATDDQMETTLLGSFAETMVPLQGCHTIDDLRSTNMRWLPEGQKLSTEKSIYCGPSICYNPETQRIHARFAHTTLSGLGEDNFRGETDPRKHKLVIATMNAGPVLTLKGARYVRVQELVVRGARMATISVEDCDAIAFDGVTSYGGASAMRVQGTRGLRMANCALRGIAAPWTFRSSLKYRSIEARVFSASSWTPQGGDNEDFEIARCEFTDCVDGVFIGNVRNISFHHNLVENISDDGMFLTCGTAPDGTTHGGNVHLWQNRFARCLTVFAFGVGHGRQKMLPTGRQTGAGVWAHNNVFDQRQWVPYFQPRAGEPDELTFKGRLCGDHGSPAWEPMSIYHNTIISGDAPFRGGYLDGLGRAVAPGSPRRLFNNLLVQCTGIPGSVFQEKNPDFIADGNLHWGIAPDAPVTAEEFLRKMRGARTAEEGKARYPAGWAAQDQYADPRFVKFSPDHREPVDLRLQAGSPALAAGVPIPAEWPLPLRSASTRGDLGAVPAGTSPWLVGVGGRLDVFGQKVQTSAVLATLALPLPAIALAPKAPGKPVAVVEGYPAFDAPMLLHALRKEGREVEHIERTWLDTSRWQEFSMVVFVGSLSRAKAPVSRFSVEDLARVRSFLEQGGTLLLLRATTEMFATDHGQAFLKEVCGEGPRQAATPAQVLIPGHAWVKHVTQVTSATWLGTKAVAPLRMSKGERILGTQDGIALLGRVPVGKGALVYVGWDVAASLPEGRKAATPEMEQVYEEQQRIIEKILAGGS